MTARPALRNEIAAGIIAGIAGGILIHVFLLGAQMSRGITPESAVEGTYAFIASALMGAGALGNPAAPPIGVALHFLVSIGWALGYVYLVRSQPQLLAKPWISGAVFGLVVYVFMEIVLLTAGLYHRPLPAELALGLVAHVLFYGIPVALIVSRRLTPTPAGA